MQWRGQRPWDDLQNHPRRHADDAIQLSAPKELHGRQLPLAGLVQATNGYFYGTTIDGGANGQWDDLQNHPEWNADDAVQLLLPERVYRRRQPDWRGWSRPPMGTSTGQRRLAGPTATVARSSKSPRVARSRRFTASAPKAGARTASYPYAGLDPGHRWELLRDNVQCGANEQRRDDLQNHPEWHADDALQLLLPKRLHGRLSPRRGWSRPPMAIFYGTTVRWRHRRLWARSSACL